VQVAGTGERILLLLHGLFLDHHVFQWIIPHLKDKFTMIIPDMRAQGESSNHKSIESVMDFVTDLYLLLGVLGIEKCYVGGYCAGAPLAIGLAAEHPKMIEKVLLISPLGLDGLPLFYFGTKTPMKEVKEFQNHPFNQLIQLVEKQDRETLRTFLGKQANVRKEMEFVLDYSSDVMMKARDMTNIRWAYYTYNFTNEDRFITKGNALISRVNVPVMLFYGEKDGIIPRIVIDDYVKFLGNTLTLRTFPSGQHVVMMENGSDIAKEVISSWCCEDKENEE